MGSWRLELGRRSPERIDLLVREAEARAAVAFKFSRLCPKWVCEIRPQADICCTSSHRDQTDMGLGKYVRSVWRFVELLIWGIAGLGFIAALVLVFW